MEQPINKIASIIREWDDSDEPDARVFARRILEALREPTPQMVTAGEAWRAHCSDTDSLWEEMVQAALYPESGAYPLAPRKRRCSMRGPVDSEAGRRIWVAGSGVSPRTLSRRPFGPQERSS